MTTPRVTVPVEPTEAMESAYFSAHALSKAVIASPAEVWSAMLSAAPAPDGGARPEREDYLNLALRAQPPACEDAQPVGVDQIAKVIRASGIDRGWAQPGDADEVARRIQALGPITHPATDALRVAVEAIWEIAGGRAADGHNEAGRLSRIKERAAEILAALQAEQKGGA